MLETIIKKVVALQPDLSSMTTRLAEVIEDAIRHLFKKVFQNDNAIFAVVTLPKFKIKWIESQTKKYLYKQMLIQEIRSLAADNELMVVQGSQNQTAQSTRNKGMTFMISNQMMNLQLRAVSCCGCIV